MLRCKYNTKKWLLEGFFYGCIVLIVFLIVSFFRSNRKRAEQLERIEDKIDYLITQLDGKTPLN